MTKPKENKIEHNYMPIDGQGMYIYVRYAHLGERAELVVSHDGKTCISYLLTKEQEASIARILTDKCLSSITSRFMKLTTG